MHIGGARTGELCVTTFAHAQVVNSWHLDKNMVNKAIGIADPPVHHEGTHRQFAGQSPIFNVSTFEEPLARMPRHMLVQPSQSKRRFECRQSHIQFG